jgi:hypothetical protein
MLNTGLVLPRLVFDFTLEEEKVVGEKKLADENGFLNKV